MIGLRRPVALTGLLLLAHLLVVGVLWFVVPETVPFLAPFPAPFPALVPAVLSALVLWSAWQTCLPPGIVVLQLRRDGSLACQQNAGGEWQDACIFAEAMAHPLLIVLPLECAGRRYWLLLARGSAAPDDLRRLRLWLRWRPVVRKPCAGA